MRRSEVSVQAAAPLVHDSQQRVSFCHSIRMVHANSFFTALAVQVATAAKCGATTDSALR